MRTFFPIRQRSIRGKIKEYVEKYAHELKSLPGQSYQHVDLEPITEEAGRQGSKKKPKPKKPKQHRRIPSRSDIEGALVSLDNWKLRSLYYSICHVNLTKNTPLLTIGIWSFFETLTSLAGRTENTNFYAFLSPDRLQKYDLGTKKQTKPLRDALQRILDLGNATKHHHTSASFNGDQLINDMECLGDVILKLIEDEDAKKK